MDNVSLGRREGIGKGAERVECWPWTKGFYKGSSTLLLLKGTMNFITCKALILVQ